jgi:hypothetical protein
LGVDSREERDGALLRALAWDREHALGQGDVLGVPQRAVVKERVDRGEPDVAGAGGVRTLVLEVLEKRPDRRRVEVRDLQPGWWCPGCLVDVGQEEPERVAVACDRVRADASLTDQPVGVKYASSVGARLVIGNPFRGGFQSSGHQGEQVRGGREVVVGAGWRDVPHVGRQQRQPSLHVEVVGVPVAQRVDREAVAQAVRPRTAPR